MRGSPNDVLRSKGCIATEENLGVCGLEGHTINDWHVPAIVEFQANITLNPGEGILLANSTENVVARVERIRLPGWNKLTTALLIILRFNLLKGHSDELAIFDDKAFRGFEVDERNVFSHRVILFPRRRFHFVEARADDNFNVLATKPTSCAAAVHCGVTTAKHDYTLTYLIDVTKRYGRQEIDTDLEISFGFLAARNIKVASTRSTRTNKDCIPALVQYLFQAFNALVNEIYVSDICNVVHLFIDD